LHFPGSLVIVMQNIGTNTEFASSLLRKGELVAIPTETVYGLAANTLNPLAVAKIFEIKKRPSFDPLIVHISSVEEMGKYVTGIPEMASLLAETFWPGPMTMVLPKSNLIPGIVTSGLDTVAIRIPDHSLTLQLLKSVDFPLAAPSANLFGYVSPTDAVHVEKQLGDSIQYILDGGPCRIGLESTIIGFEGNKPVIYRLGGTSLEKIEAAVGKIELRQIISSNPKAPGMLKKHYATHVPLKIGYPADLWEPIGVLKVGIISFTQDYAILKPARQFILSSSGNLEEAAANLFRALRDLDESQLDLIIAEKFPEHGLGRAINDRLERAAAK
jgi:L-threonylcarbamoyladenylate synthase